MSTKRKFRHYEELGQRSILTQYRANDRQVVFKISGFYPMCLESNRVEISFSKTTYGDQVTYEGSVYSIENGYAVLVNKYDFGEVEPWELVVLAKAHLGLDIVKALNISAEAYVKSYNRENGEKTHTVYLV